MYGLPCLVVNSGVSPILRGGIRQISSTKARSSPESSHSVRRQLTCPVGDNYLGRFSPAKIADIFPHKEDRMSGKAITQKQVKLFMKYRELKNTTQEQASAKAGISERSGRRIDSWRVLPKKKQPRYWRTRKDPFADVWDSEILPLLEKTSQCLQPTTLFEDLQDRHPGRFSNKLKRTFQRRVKTWKALVWPR